MTDMTLTSSVTHNELVIKLPFPVMLEGEDPSRLVTVNNRFDPDVSIELPYFAVCVYDHILGAEATSSQCAFLHEMHSEMTELMTFVPCTTVIRLGISWFREHFPDAHFALLD